MCQEQANQKDPKQTNESSPASPESSYQPTLRLRTWPAVGRKTLPVLKHSHHLRVNEDCLPVCSHISGHFHVANDNRKCNGKFSFHFLTSSNYCVHGTHKPWHTSRGRRIILCSLLFSFQGQNWGHQAFVVNVFTC